MLGLPKKQTIKICYRIQLWFQKLFWKKKLRNLQADLGILLMQQESMTWLFHWLSAKEKHTNEDELFYVLKGELTIQMKAPLSDITLHQGELAVIPKGVEHCPKSLGDTYILMFEPYVLKRRGD